MYISKAKKYRDQGDGTAIAYDYYRLTKSYIDKDGKTKHRSVLCLGELPGFDKDERNRLAAIQHQDFKRYKTHYANCIM